ncbi:MAG: hypothetical protein MJ189_05400 [Coriobacteriales bacterium]|nr:hypothetical protein [Coriobacteriales bacterium]
MKTYLQIIKTGQKIGLIDADLIDGGTRHPNLALMKISGYCKTIKGCQTNLLTDYSRLEEYDQVFISKVFSYTKTPETIEKMQNVHLGGTGFFGADAKPLPNKIEHHMPDYNLYLDYVINKIQNGKKRSWYADYLDYSIGFTTRGCFRHCEFCVNKNANKAVRHSPVSEFLDPSRPYIYLWDDNFLAFSGWEDILEELQATGKPFQFRQGLDIRLLTEKKAKALSQVRYKGGYIFAFDHIEEKQEIEQALKMWRAFTKKETRLYLLCAFDSQDGNDIENLFKRIKILMHYQCLPYVMRFEDYEKSEWRGVYVI